MESYCCWTLADLGLCFLYLVLSDDPSVQVCLISVIWVLLTDLAKGSFIEKLAPLIAADSHRVTGDQTLGLFILSSMVYDQSPVTQDHFWTKVTIAGLFQPL